MAGFGYPAAMNQFARQVIGWVAAAALFVVWGSPAAQAADERPNVVIILADDMGFADVGFNNCPDFKTPNIDRIAKAGVKLNQWYVQPLCSPTRAALMTGRYPMRDGLQVGVVRPWASYGLPLEERTIAQALKDAGYETAITGKWHLGLIEPAYLPTHRGFDHQYGHYNGAIDYNTHIRDGGFDWHRDDKVNHDEGYSTHLIAKEAVKRIAERDKSKPLFLYVPFNAVHSPHQVPAKYKEPYQSLPEPRRTYAGMMTAMDEGIGQILDAIDANQMTDNTLVWFSSDNGGPQPGKVTNNTPLRGGKGSLWEGGVHVAGCAKWPGKIPAGGEVDQPLHIVDVYPTLLKLAGADLSKQKLPLDGKDAWDTIAKGAPSPHDAILLNATPLNGAIRMGDWKLIVGKGQGLTSAESQEGNAAGDDDDAGGGGAKAAKAGKGKNTKEQKKAVQQAKQVAAADGPGLPADAPVMLFNLANDIGEKKNVAAEHPDKVKELRAAYDRLAAQAIPPKNRPKDPNFKSPAVWGEK
jgi:arylsulfatase A-like enzyme